MIPALAVAIFDFSEEGTVMPPYSSAVPLFFNVPTYVPAAKVPFAAESTAASTEGSTPLATVPTNHLQSALSDRARDGEDNVGPFGEEGRRVRLAGRLVIAVTDKGALAVAYRERARALGRCPTEDLHGLVVGLVVVAHAGHKAVHVERHRRELLAPVRGDRVGRGHAGRENASEEARLVGLVLQ